MHGPHFKGHANCCLTREYTDGLRTSTSFVSQEADECFSLVSLVQSLASLRVDPFLPPQAFSEAVQLLAPAAASVKPFEVTLDALGVFGGKRRGVLYAYSSDPGQTRALIELQATLQASTAPPRPNPLRTDPCH